MEMDSAPVVEDKEFIHFKKMNILGYSGVGKSSLISLFENYKNDNFKIKKEIANSIDDSLEISNNLVDQVKKVIIPINDKRNINLLIYETNINNFNAIKSNLDTLLFQTENIIIMWDTNHSNSFDKIPDLITIINSMVNEKIIEKINIFLIQNKSDLEFDISKDGPSENEIQQKLAEVKNIYKNTFIMKTSLLNKDDMLKLIYDIDRYYNPEIFTENDAMNLIKIKYPFKAIKNEENEKTIDICLLGDSKTGKTSFIKNLIGEDEYNNLQEKSEQNFLLKITDENLIMKISDSSGKIINGNNFDLYKKSHIFLLFFDVTKKESFTSLENYLRIIQDKAKGSIFIIGNKIDEKGKRKVNKGEAKTFAKKNFCKYFECSCLCGINVLEIFNEISLDGYKKFNEFNINRVNSFSLKNEEMIDNKGNIILKKKSQGCCS